MPGYNPLIGSEDGSSVLYTPGIESLISQDPRPGAIAGTTAMNTASSSQINAAGTSENVNQHVAIMVVLFGLGVIGLNKLGFKFAGTASVGIGR